VQLSQHVAPFPIVYFRMTTWVDDDGKQAVGRYRDLAGHSPALLSETQYAGTVAVFLVWTRTWYQASLRCSWNFEASPGSLHRSEARRAKASPTADSAHLCGLGIDESKNKVHSAILRPPQRRKKQRRDA
jgi:hypothetical protein